MGKPNESEVVKEFSKLIAKEIKYYFGGKKDINPDLVVEFLCREGLVRPETIRDYMVINDYPKLLAINDNVVGDTLLDLSIKYDMNVRTIKRRIYDHYKKFKPKNNILEINP